MPISFTCPSCGQQSNVADQYIGQTGPCSACGQMVTVSATPGVAGAPPLRGKSGGGSNTGAIVAIVVGVVLVTFLLCGGVMTALLLPAVQAAREAARRAQCSNNLRQIALALHTYHDVWDTLPPAYVADSAGKPMHSWRVLILPYMDAQALYGQYDFNEPWDGPNNSRLADQIPAAFRCPSDPGAGNETHYMVVVGEGTPFEPGLSTNFTKLSATPGGVSGTLMVVESTTGANWMSPVDLDLNQMSMVINDPARPAIGSHHAPGANAAYADGSVRFLQAGLTPEALRAMLTGGSPSDQPNKIELEVP